MFRMLNSGLPRDPYFEANLDTLGYFINEEDEIRSKINPKAYFNFFVTKNERYNTLQREAFNGAIRQEVSTRLHDLHLDTVRLPLGVSQDEPHVPILVSRNIRDKKRIIMLFYEHNQDLGIFAHRTIGGKGGINAGSAVNFVKYIQSLPSGPGLVDSPGIIIVNMGQLKWWRRGKQAVTQTTWYSLPQKTAVSEPYQFDTIKNTVPGNRNTAEHLAYIFNNVIAELIDPKAVLDIIGVSEGAVQLVEFLNKPCNWVLFQSRMNAVVLLACFHHRDEIDNEEFAAWLRKRGRAYVVSSEPAGTAVAGPDGGPHTAGFGCPTYSIGEPYYPELMLPIGYHMVLDWLQDVSTSPDYVNSEVQIAINRADEVANRAEEEGELPAEAGDTTDHEAKETAGDEGNVEKEDLKSPDGYRENAKSEQMKQASQAGTKVNFATVEDEDSAEADS